MSDVRGRRVSMECSPVGCIGRVRWVCTAWAGLRRSLRLRAHLSTLGCWWLGGESEGGTASPRTALMTDSALSRPQARRKWSTRLDAVLGRSVMDGGRQRQR